MALTVRRWVLCFSLGAAALALAAWPEPQLSSWGSLATQFYNPQQIAGLADMNLRSAKQALAVLERRDHILTMEPTAGARPHLTVEGPVPPPAVANFTAAFDSVIGALHPRAPDIDVRTVIVADTSPPIASAPNGVWFLTPTATDGRTCLTVAFVPRYQRQFLAEAERLPWSELRQRARRLLGPCAFYASFGRAGPGVEHWLQSHDFLFAMQFDPDAARPALDRVRRELVDSTGTVQASLTELLALLFQGSAAPFVRPTLTERSCAHGTLEACRKFDRTPEFPSTPPLGPAYAIARAGLWQPSWVESPWLLSDLLRDAGPERFAQIWRSPAPLDSAFEAAMGKTLEEWTHGWMLGRFDHPQFGPDLSLGTVAAGLLLLIVLAAAGTWAAARRQVL